MADDDAIEVYLNDHLAGAAMAIDLLDRIRENNKGTALAGFLDGLRPEIDADRATLAGLMDRLGIPRSTPKQLAAKVTETLSRLRLSSRVTGSPAVSRLMELETLSLGIEGKASLWRALAAVEVARQALADVDFAGLTSRAVEQRAGVEPHRLEAAAAALSAGGA